MGKVFNHYLLEFPSNPIALEEDKIYYIGRGEDNSVTIDSTFVSRRHTSIYFENDQFFIRDLSSTNGTFLNSSKVEKTALKNGDQVGIGDRIFIFYSEISEKDGIEGARMRNDLISNRITISRKGQMAGNFEEYAFLELLQYLSTRRRTGTLMLKLADNSEGLVEFREGHIGHSFYQSQKGMDAIEALARCELDSFQFDPKHKTDIVSIDKPTSLVFLDIFNSQNAG